jgi:chromosome partitioning protein
MNRHTRRLVNKRFRPKGRNWPLLYAFLLACGGSTKSTSATSLAVTLAGRGVAGTIWDLDGNLSTTRVLGYDEEGMKGRKTVYDLITDPSLSIEDVRVPARFRIGDGYGDEAFEVIENLWLIPGSPEMPQADTYIALDPDRNDWFLDILHGYDGDDDAWYLDFPAGYGKMVYSVVRMLDDDDSVIPSVRADPKDVNMIPDLFKELERVREKNRNKRAVPGRPFANHLILTGTPTPSYNEAPARRATELATARYSDILLPFVRYSADAKKLYEDQCPLPILLPNSYPSVDYRKVATALGFK